MPPSAICPFDRAKYPQKYTFHIETRAGEGSDFSDEEYRNAGAEIIERKDLFAGADLIVKVKEPIPSERFSMRVFA